ncbi:MAG: c-type cytochrome, partial [Burkholderiales bacterium]
PRVEKTGQQVADGVCAACHVSGAMNAPRMGNKGDWAPRIAQGYTKLLKNARVGIRQMPARGGAADLSDLEVARAVVHMANRSGASFPEPKIPKSDAASPKVAVTGAVGGKSIYDTTCVACHGAGVAGAPRIGDKAAWGLRIKTGTESLYRSALKGKNAMPAKGGSLALSDADVKAAVDYLVSQSK